MYIPTPKSPLGVLGTEEPTSAAFLLRCFNLKGSTVLYPANGSLLAVYERTPYRNYQRTIRNYAEGTNCALHIYELLIEVYHQQ